MKNDRGAIFDWDGVIINSAVHHEESWERLARETGKTLPKDHFKRGFGMKNEVIIPELLGWTSNPAEVGVLSLRKEAIYREVVRERGIAALPGVEAWLRTLREAGSRASSPPPPIAKTSSPLWRCSGSAIFLRPSSLRRT
jgi:beta-phosphoglucomutase-like phosphatase (HAD superfamily)